MKFLLICFIVAFCTVFLTAQSDVRLSAMLSNGIYRLAADDIDTDFDYGLVMGLDIYVYGNERLIEPLGRIGFTRQKTSNKFNRFELTTTQLNVCGGVKVEPGSKQFSLMLYAGLAPYLSKKVQSADARKSSDVAAYFNTFDRFLGMQLNTRLLSFSRSGSLFENIDFTISYEHGITNLINRYAIHLSSRGDWIRSRSIKAGLLFAF